MTRKSMSPRERMQRAARGTGIAVAAPPAPPTLNALSLSQTSFTIGTPASGSISGATTGSTIDATGLPTGFTINGAARTWNYDGTGSAGTVSPTFTETLAGATNTPRPTVIGITYAAAPAVAGYYTFDHTQLETADQTVYNNIVAKTSSVSGIASYPATFDRTVTVTSAAQLQTEMRLAYNSFKAVWTDIVCEEGGDWSTSISLMSAGNQQPVAMTGGIRIRKGATDPNFTGAMSFSGANNVHIEGLRFTRQVVGNPDTLENSCLVVQKCGDNGGLSPELAFFNSSLRVANCRFGVRFDPAKASVPESNMARAITLGTALGIIIEDCEFHGCFRGIIADRVYKCRIWRNRFQHIVLNPLSLAATGIQDGVRTRTDVHPEAACYYDVYNNLVLPPPDNLDGSVQGDAAHIDYDQNILNDNNSNTNPDPNHWSNHTPAVAHCYRLHRVNFVLCDNESFNIVGTDKKGAIINGYINSDYSGGSPCTTVMVGNIGATNGFSIQDGANSLTIYAFNTWGAAPATRPGAADNFTNGFAKALAYGSTRPGFVPTFRAYANITHGFGATGGSYVAGLPANIDMNTQPGTPAGSRPQQFLNGTWENTSHDSGWWQNKINWEVMTTAQIKAALFSGWTPKAGVNAGAKIAAPV